MNKTVDFTKTVYELSKENPEIVRIMKDLGFTDITKKAALTTVGRIMTIPKGSEIKGIGMDKILQAFEENGYEITGLEEQELSDTAKENENKEQNTDSAPAPASAEEDTAEDDSRSALLKSYIRRLNEGEDLETVRAEFVENFENVEASEIMNAEQELLQGGVPLEHVQKLCDVHSALFHGATKEEQYANMYAEEAASLQRKAAMMQNMKLSASAALIGIEGHPLRTFHLENDGIAALIKEMRSKLAQELDVTEDLKTAHGILIHYEKKGDLLYPLLKVKYDTSGPNDVMWTVDDEIRDEINRLTREEVRDEQWEEDLLNVLTRADEMIYKEENILFPICAEYFSAEEWEGIYRDAFAYTPVFMEELPTWEGVAKDTGASAESDGQEVRFKNGHMTPKQIESLLNTIPMEITFVDEDNINRYFNEGPKVFKRPGMAVDREVFDCHPPKVEPMVRAIIDDFRSGRRDTAPVWIEKDGMTMLVTYAAVRDFDGTYIGTAELSYDMAAAKAHFLGED